MNYDLKSKFPVLGLFLLIALFFARIYPALSSTDSYYHLAIGRQVAQTHRIPKYDTFTFIAEGKEFISNEWLSGLMLYLTYTNFGDLGILALRTIVGTLTLILLFLTLKTAFVHPKIAFLATLVCSAAIATRLFDRPEMFSFLLFALEFFLLEKYRQTQKLKSLLPLPPIFLLWANIQGYAPIGIVVFAYYLATRSVLVIQTQKRGLSSLNALKPVFVPAAFFLISFLAATFTPGQFKRFFYAFYLNKDLFPVVTEVKSLFGRLAEIRYDFWQHIPIEVYLFLPLFILGLILLSASFTKKTLLKNIVDLAYFLFICALGFKFFRVIPLSILLISPLFFRKLNWALIKLKPSSLNLIILPLSFILALVMLVSIFENRLWGFKANYLFVSDTQNQVMVAASTSWKERLPHDALNFVKANFKPQKLLTALNWSSQAIWYLGPDTKVFSDIIYEKHTKVTLSDYGKLATGTPGWQKSLEKYNPDIIVNTQLIKITDVFVVPAWELADWNLVYVDDTAAVYANSKSLTDQNRILKAIHPEYQDSLKFKEEEISQAKTELEYLLSLNRNNSFALNQLTQLEIANNNHQSALELAEEGTKIHPNNPEFYFLKALSLYNLNKCKETAQPLSRAKHLSGGYYFIKKDVENLAKSCGIKL